MIEASKRLRRVKRIFDPYKERRHLVRLDRNEDPAGWDEEHFTGWLKTLTPYDLAAYADSTVLADKLAGWLGVNRDGVYITAGSDAGIKNIFETFVDPGDKVLVQTPSWAMYEVYANVYQARLEKLAYDEEIHFDFDELIQQISTTNLRMVLLANPNQPTGTLFTEEQVEAILEVAEARDILVVMDEAYHLFTPRTALDHLGARKNLIITRTFSKAFGLAGLRIGYCISCPDRISDLMLLRPVTDANSLALSCASYALDNIDWINARIADMLEGRAYLLSTMQESGLACFPSATNFLLVRYPDFETGKRVVEQCLAAGYSLKGPFTFPPLENCIRISIGTLALMEEFWADCSGILCQAPD